MYDVIPVCQYIAWRSYGRGCEPLTNLRLQKILYFLQLVFLFHMHEPCFNNKMEAWNLGPVVPKAYRAYAKYRAGEIPGERTLAMEIISPKHRKVIDELLESFDAYSTGQLIMISRCHSPWKKNYVNYDTHEIPLGDLISFIKEFVDDIARFKEGESFK